MGTLNITLTYPDGEGANILRDLRSYYGQVEDPPDSGTFRDRTLAECRALFSQGCSESLKHICRMQRKSARDAIAPEADPTITA